jgi:hypothetical protein
MAIIVLLANFRIKTLFAFFFFGVGSPSSLYSLFISSFDYIKKKASKLIIAHPHLSSFDIVIFHSKKSYIHSASNPKTKQNKTKHLKKTCYYYFIAFLNTITDICYVAVTTQQQNVGEFKIIYIYIYIYI